MKCNEKNIKELFPLLVKQGLDEKNRKRIEEHVATCEDCSKELSLVQIMSDEAVPDPGEAFWTTMPGRIEREVRRQKERTSFADILNAVFMPRWAWTMATVGILAVASWLLVRPATVQIAGPSENMTAHEAVELVEPIDLAGLSSTELNAAVQWARNEFEPIRDSVEGMPENENTERDISDDLSKLSPDELDRVYDLLKKKEQDIRNRLQKSKKEKRLG